MALVVSDYKKAPFGRFFVVRAASLAMAIGVATACAQVVAAEDYAVWQDKRYVIAYNPSGKPNGISDADVIDALAHAAAVWASCGVRVEFGGFTRRPIDHLDGVNVIGWQVDIPGLMALTLPQYLRRILLDADIRLSAGLVRDADTLRQVIAHEVGHALGLFMHSAEADSLMNEKRFLSPRLDTPSGQDMQSCQQRYDWK